MARWWSKIKAWSGQGRFWVMVVMLAIFQPPWSAFAQPGFQEVKAAYVSSEAWLLDRYGLPIHSLRRNPQIRRFPWTQLSDVSPALCQAVILSEDRRFYEHAGVDWIAAGHAAWNNLWHRQRRGASTLTMQLAGLLEDEEKPRGRRGFVEKINQAALALRLEEQWSKEQILEAYLNLVHFRGEQQGVAAMSQSLFGKWPNGLDEQESALAAALLRAPNASSLVVMKRACGLLMEMGRASECNGLAALTLTALSGGLRAEEEKSPLSPSLAPHLARKLLQEPGQRVRSSIDGGLQRAAVASLTRHLADLKSQNVRDGAVLVVENGSGEILAWVGSSGALSDAAEVDGVTALRQAGSTLKPFLYALAFAERFLTPASLIEDAPLSLETGNGLYAPQNYEPQYQGWVSARMALAGSLNVPAVKTLVRVGPEAFLQGLHRAGFASLTEEGDWYGYSLALGSGDVSVLMLANGYRTLANGGRWSPLRVSSDGREDSVPCRRGGCAEVFSGDARSAFTPQSAFLVADILADPAARANTFGLESWLATPYWAAVKTGTSKDMRDNWCAGFSRDYTTVVWVGNAGGDPMHEVSGVSGAAPIWREVMDWLHRGDPGQARPRRASLPPAAPPGVVSVPIRFEPPLEPPRQEWFVSGTERSVIQRSANSDLAAIQYPTEGMVIVLDPDIPLHRQRLPLLLTAPARAGWQWQMDAQPLGQADRRSYWLPQPGAHHLSLLDATGQEKARVRFEVKALRGQGRHQ